MQPELKKTTSFTQILRSKRSSSPDRYVRKSIHQFEGSMTRFNLIDFDGFIILEEAQEIHELSDDEWKNIFQKNTLKNHNAQNIHYTLLKRDLGIEWYLSKSFNSTRKLWLMQSNQQRIGKIDYRKYLDNKNNHRNISQIEKDVPRTLIISDNQFFKDVYKIQQKQKKDNQNSLRNILVAYSNSDYELGYTQGMNYLVANILICYDLRHNQEGLDDYEIIENNRDENVFRIFSSIMIDKGWRQVFMDGFPGLIRMIDELHQRIKNELPQLYSHFEYLDIFDLKLAFQPFYLSLLMQESPLDFSRTVLNLFLLEGEIVIQNLIIAMLKYVEKHLLSLQDFMTLIHYIKKDMIREFWEYFQGMKKDEKSFLLWLKQLGLIKQIDVEQQQKQPEIIQKPQNTSPIKKTGSIIANKIRRFFK